MRVRPTGPAFGNNLSCSNRYLAEDWKMTLPCTTAKKTKPFKRAKPKKAKAQHQKCKASVDETAPKHQNIYPIQP